ncbi:MAG: hypothetical protein CL678_00050 [Bdellovibrionaceae bacterium]|nr:hypothetical protein [Pseudobdellovibrionaceae bacterium]
MGYDHNEQEDEAEWRRRPPRGREESRQPGGPQAAQRVPFGNPARAHRTDCRSEQRRRADIHEQIVRVRRRVGLRRAAAIWHAQGIHLRGRFLHCRPLQPRPDRLLPQVHGMHATGADDLLQPAFAVRALPHRGDFQWRPALRSGHGKSHAADHPGAGTPVHLATMPVHSVRRREFEDVRARRVGALLPRDVRHGRLVPGAGRRRNHAAQRPWPARDAAGRRRPPCAVFDAQG